MPNRRLEDPLIGDFDARDEPIFFFGECGFVAKGPELSCALVIGEESGNRVGRHAACDVAGSVPTHAVRNEKKPLIGEDAVAVLIVFALETNVCEPGCNEVHGDGSKRCVGMHSQILGVQASPSRLNQEDEFVEAA